jgi:hypothetical protein
VADDATSASRRYAASPLWFGHLNLGAPPRCFHGYGAVRVGTVLSESAAVVSDRQSPLRTSRCPRIQRPLHLPRKGCAVFLRFSRPEPKFLVRKNLISVSIFNFYVIQNTRFPPRKNRTRIDSSSIHVDGASCASTRPDLFSWRSLREGWRRIHGPQVPPRSRDFPGWG